MRHGIRTVFRTLMCFWANTNQEPLLWLAARCTANCNTEHKYLIEKWIGFGRLSLFFLLVQCNISQYTRYLTMWYLLMWLIFKLISRMDNSERCLRCCSEISGQGHLSHSDPDKYSYTDYDLRTFLQDLTKWVTHWKVPIAHLDLELQCS